MIDIATNFPFLNKYIGMYPKYIDTEYIVAQYSEKHRGYHNLNHIEYMLENLEVLGSKYYHAFYTSFDFVFQKTEQSNLLLSVAIIWHDAIYDPTASDNELRSAEKFEKFANENGGVEKDIKAISNLIKSTSFSIDNYEYTKEGSHEWVSLTDIVSL